MQYLILKRQSTVKLYKTKLLQGAMAQNSVRWILHKTYSQLKDGPNLKDFCRSLSFRTAVYGNEQKDLFSVDQPRKILHIFASIFHSKMIYHF